MKKRVVFLYAYLAQYFVQGIEDFVERFDEYHAHIIRWPDSEMAPYTFDENEKITYYVKSDYTASELKALVHELNPVLIYTSGWMDSDYFKIVRSFRKSVPVLCGLDNPWTGSLKQRVLSAVSALTLRRVFTHFWVPGIRQYEFARRMGYPNNKILWNLLCGNSTLFSDCYDRNIAAKAREYPKQMLYVGRFLDIKGVGDLYHVFSEMTDAEKNGWRLRLIGNGPLKEKMNSASDLDIIDFMPQEQLAMEVANSGLFCLPSWDDHWGVVVHEFMLAGLPMLCSDMVNAGYDLIIPGYNGMFFRARDQESLRSALISFFRMDVDHLRAMSRRSHTSAGKISTEKWAFSLKSALPD